jgi:hypothetical protein
MAPVEAAAGDAATSRLATTSRRIPKTRYERDMGIAPGRVAPDLPFLGVTI